MDVTPNYVNSFNARISALFQAEKLDAYNKF